MIQLLLINLIVNIIYLTLLSDYLFLIVIVISSISTKSTNVFKYKVNNFILSIFFALSYILFFIVLLYALRIYNLGQFLDLKVIYNNVLLMYALLSCFSIYYKIIIIMFLLLSLILFLLLFIKFHKFFINHIFSLYLYFFFHNTRFSFFKQIKFKLFGLGSTDLVTYYFYTLCIKYNKLFYPRKDMLWFDVSKISKYNLYYLFSSLMNNSKYKMFINLSPILFIVFDCIFNQFVLISTYHYLLFYTPLILIKRITICVVNTFGFITDTLWNIYYNEKKYLYALSKEQKQLLDIYLLAELNSYKEPILKLTLNDVPFSIYLSIQFELNQPERHSYCNNGIHLIKTEDGRVFEEIEEVIDTEDGKDFILKYKLGEEWVLIIDKS